MSYEIRPLSRSSIAKPSAINAAGHTSFAARKQAKAGVFDTGYPKARVEDGPVVLLAHGWPHDINGTAVYLSHQAQGKVQPFDIAADIIALMDAIGIDKAIATGFGWGAHTVDIMAALWPDRFIAVVSATGHRNGAPRIDAEPLMSKPRPLGHQAIPEDNSEKRPPSS